MSRLYYYETDKDYFKIPASSDEEAIEIAKRDTEERDNNEKVIIVYKESDKDNSMIVVYENL